MMVLLTRNVDMDEAMPQTVPSAGFTPPCDYSNFADNFDLSLLPGGDLPLSPSTPLYNATPPPSAADLEKPKIYATYHPGSPQSVGGGGEDLGPDFQTLLVPETTKTSRYPQSPGYLEVPSAKNYHANSPTGALSPYSSPRGLLSPNVYATAAHPASPDVSFYSPPYPAQTYIKKETLYQPPPSPACHFQQQHPYEVKEESGYLPPACRLAADDPPDLFQLLDGQVKQEAAVDFGAILQDFLDGDERRRKPKEDHQLLREVLRDTSFQRRYNIRTFDFAEIMSAAAPGGGGVVDAVKVEEEEAEAERDLEQEQLMAGEDIEPVLSMAIEQMRRDVDTTCAALGISPDPARWSSKDVVSWLQFTAGHFGLPPPVPERWEIAGKDLVHLSEEEFTRRAPQGGVILYAQLEIWKAACSEEDLGMQWMPESASSNASSGDMSDEEEDETSAPPKQPQPPQQQPEASGSRPGTSRSTGGGGGGGGGSHIHLWQFLKELLASPQVHGSCIRWLDRPKGVFKIEDSVKVARLWGKRKNRPAMNYDKLSRSIRQYYKKGIMKKTERSQRLVYQFCHPYNL